MQEDHEDHIAGKGHISMTHYILVHKFIPMPQVMKIPDAKAAVDKEWKKFETTPAWQLDKVKSKKKVIQEHKKNKKKVHLEICFIDGHLSSKECGVGTTVPEVRGSSRALRRRCEG